MPTSDWYVWSSRALPWGQPWDDTTPVWHPARDRSYYGLFSPEMPDLNWRNPDVRREMFDIAQWWVQRGIAGFRLDAARYLIENGSGNGQRDQRLTREIWRELRQALQGRATQDEVLLLGEIWSDTATSASYLSELQMVFGFERAFGLRQALKQGERAPLKTRLCKELAALRFAAASESGQPRTPAFASFLSNHDMARFASAISDDPRVLRLAATLLLTLPGTPYLYYGEEIGLRNGPGQGDRAQRLPMRWNSQPGFGFTPPQDLDDRADVSSPRANVSVAAQVNDPDSLLSHYRRLIQLRVKSPALSGGATRILRSKSSGGSVLAVLRERGRSRVLIIANISIEPARRIEVFGAQNEGQRDLYPGLPPFGAEIIPL